MGSYGVSRSVWRLGRNLRSQSGRSSALRRHPCFPVRVFRGGELSSYAERMSKKNKINRIHKIDETTRRTRYFERARAQRVENVFDCKRGWNLDARIMMTERMQLMCVGSGDQWFAEASRGFFCAPVWIKD